MEIIDISVTSHRSKGERRKSGIGNNHTYNPEWEKPKNRNPLIDASDHAKHVQMIYREAMRGTKY